MAVSGAALSGMDGDDDAALDRRSLRRRAARRAWRSLLRAKWPLLAILILSIVFAAAAFGPSLPRAIRTGRTSWRACSPR